MPPKRAIGNEEPPFTVVLYNEDSFHNTVILRKDYKTRKGKKAGQLEEVNNGFVLNVVGKAPDDYPYYEVTFKSQDSGILTKGYCKKTHCWATDEEDLRAQKRRKVSQDCASSSSSQRPPDVAPPPPPTPQLPANRHDSQSVKSESESESEPAPEGRPGCVDYPTSLCSGNRSMELHRVIRSSNSDYLGQTLCDACLGEVLLARPFIKTRPLKDEGP